MSFPSLSPWPVRSLSRCQKQVFCFRRLFCSTRQWQKEEEKLDSQARLQREIEGPEPKLEALGPLSRPLGVTQRPTALLKTRAEKIKEYLTDSDVRMAQRRQMCVIFDFVSLSILTNDP